MSSKRQRITSSSSSEDNDEKKKEKTYYVVYICAHEDGMSNYYLIGDMTKKNIEFFDKLMEIADELDIPSHELIDLFLYDFSDCESWDEEKWSHKKLQKHDFVAIKKKLKDDTSLNEFLPLEFPHLHYCDIRAFNEAKLKNVVVRAMVDFN